MFLRFDCKAGSFLMHADHALPLIRMMGHGGTVPGAIAAADLPAARTALAAGLAARGDDGPLPAEATGDADPETLAAAVPLSRRAWPLMDLLERAARRGCAVAWDRA